MTENPEASILLLHRIAISGPAHPDTFFALAGTSFHHAEESGKQSYYLAAIIYAIAFLFPDDSKQRPHEFDPRIRTASDLYNRSLTSAFATDDRSRVMLRSIDIKF